MLQVIVHLGGLVGRVLHHVPMRWQLRAVSCDPVISEKKGHDAGTVINSNRHYEDALLMGDLGGGKWRALARIASVGYHVALDVRVQQWPIANQTVRCLICIWFG
jgi:hypothetical protein